ncbi:hypothetical protein [Eleftheria terrae]|uniref:hypothetical protein n=1 Tax=Eleftheria terrae TaxID=1597781 RepID=UPI00263A8939|nr:hypothetical protein [Eleftheria terrae]WKB53847.1 hypothetical protein N7L95_05530 [Eleftheria terrae]
MTRRRLAPTLAVALSGLLLALGPAQACEAAHGAQHQHGMKVASHSDSAPVPEDRQAPDAVFSKTAWRIEAVSCPAGCSEETRRFLDGLKGKEVALGEQTFSAPFADSCDGQLSVRLQSLPAKDVAQRVNLGLPPRKAKLTPRQLGLRQDPVKTGSVNCTSDKLESPLATLLSVEPGRVLVLFEQQSVIELR